jgi:hypothetical protein
MVRAESTVVVAAVGMAVVGGRCAMGQAGLTAVGARLVLSAR